MTTVDLGRDGAIIHAALESSMCGEWGKQAALEAFARYEACADDTKTQSSRQAPEMETLVRVCEERERGGLPEAKQALVALADRADRLEAALRAVVAAAEPREWETPGHPMNEWTRREPILRIAREGLAPTREEK